MSKRTPSDRPRRVTRQRQAGAVTRQETRRRVLSAASAEFAKRGYRGATVVRIAERAEVAVPTLYSAWGSKRALLRAVMSQAVTGHDDGFAAGRDPAELLGSPGQARDADATGFLAHLAHRYRHIAERSAVGWKTYRDGAAVDPKIDADWNQLQAGRRETFRALLAHLPDTAWRPGLSRDAAVDTAWAIVSPETHELFVVRRGWDYDRYEQWVTTTLTAALLPQPPSTT